jgi:glycosyltransferase involved in cell wall biosynthesis
MKTISDLGICFVSSYKPRKCGIATFTQSIINNFPDEIVKENIKIVAISKQKNEYKYPQNVIAEIAQDDVDSYIKAAEAINSDPSINIVSLQHVFSLFGGAHGDKVVHFLSHLKKPVVTTLHMVYPINEEPNKFEIVESNFADTTDILIKYSEKIVVIIQPMVDILIDEFHVPEEKIFLIPHGAPLFCPQDTAYFKQKLGLGKGQIISSFGLIRDKKGLEYAIRAMPDVVKKYPKAKLFILGESHPYRPMDYYERLKKEAEDVGLLYKNIFFKRKYLSLREIITHLFATDVFIAPYLVPEQTSSGAVAYALGCGKAIIATPFLYAKEALSRGRGLLVNYQDPQSIYRAIDYLFSNPDHKKIIERKAWNYAQKFSFAKVSRKYANLFLDTVNTERQQTTNK